MKGKVVYEHPLNENMRNWLRLEHLFNYVEQRSKGMLTQDSCEALQGIIGILEYLSRMDCKPELIKDLERRLKVLKKWRTAPGVDESRLEELMDKLRALMDALSIMEGQPGQVLTRHHLLMVIKQRIHIPGGGCGFDAPGYAHWQQQNHKQRQQDLFEWSSAFYPLKEAVELNLYLIRQHAIPAKELAPKGFYQAKLGENMEAQMLQVILPGGTPFYPEVSGGRHRFTLRFFEYEQLNHLPIQTAQDVEFELACCG